MQSFHGRQLAGCFTALALSLAGGVLAGEVTFTRTSLKTVGETNMGDVPVVDVNGDGVVDIVAGLQWFEGPSWKPHPLYPPDSKPTAIDIGFTVPYDLDGDGDLDLTAHRRSSDDRNKNELFWFENPGPPSTGAWTKHHITWDMRWPEVIVFVDIDGDGRDEMVCSDVCPGKGIRIYEIPKDPKTASNWSWTTVDKSPLHGLGIGDLNEDGRPDIVSDFVWFERRASGDWARHSLPSPGAARRGHETMQIEVYDVDGDGDNDLLVPRAHHYGAYWLESSGGKRPSFKLHEILPGKLPSQLHGVAYADIDGDGDLDIFAGKSRYRHGDPGNDDPLDVFWIELVRSSGRVAWVKHQLATDLTMGIGPTIADIDADGDMDLVLRGHGIGGRYVIGTRQTQVTLFIRKGSPPAERERKGTVRIWDANKKYTMKHYDMRAWQNRDAWSQVPYGTTDNQFRGDAILEGENFWLSLHSSRHDSVFLYAKTDAQATPGRHNELYRAFDTPDGRWTNYGSGSERCRIITNTPHEIEVESASITYTRKGYVTTVVTRYRLRAGKPWLEISPISQADMQGMHGESRFVLAPEAAEDGSDFVEDSLRHPGNYASRVPNRATMLLDLIMDDDTIWVLTSRKLPEDTQFERRPTRFSADNAAGGWHAGWSRIGEDDCDRVWTAPFIQFTGQPVYIGVLRIGYWHYQRVGQKVTKGEPVTLNWKIAYTRQVRSSPFKPGGTWRPMHPGKWRLVTRVNDRHDTVPITVSAAQAAPTSLTFESPATGELEYVIFYLYDRTGETPKEVRTPMDVYRAVAQQ